MELDQLKNVFAENTGKLGAMDSRTNIQLRINEQSASPVSLFKRNLVREFIIAVLFSIFPVYVFISYQGFYISMFAVISLLIILDFCFQISRLLKSIHRFEHRTHAIVQHHRLLVEIIKKFCSLYLRSTLILLPLLFISAFILVHIDNIQKDPLLFQVNYQNAVLLYIGISVVWTILMFVFTRWYLDKLYGKHLRKLVAQLHELENT